ncbi:hypothetical protein IC229_33725 [Spirosoma sp. BT702]|uniref:Tape measure protein n=1 Tax=Spirosoma profusum TaxID=2771354 RepID=A0A927AWC0_9BACT|nr:hypothetical protein [Spirosoma profusum]MBD2705617.1 hypothetical protein [Spirosoma profusum]
MAGAINIRLGAIVTDFVTGFKSARDSAGLLYKELNTNLAAGYARADREQRNFDRGLGRLAKNIQSTGTSLTTYLTLPLAGLAGAGLKAASDMEQAGVSFRVLLKDANLAAQTVNDLKSFAATTPFEFSDVQSGAKQLLAYGFAVGDLKTLLTDAGNLASGFGVEIGEVTRVLGRLKSGDFGEAFERLRDFGIGRDVLEAKGLKFDKSGQFQGSVQQAFSVIQGIIRERFGGQMEEQSKTLGGIASNIKDSFTFALADIGTQLVKTFNLKEVGTGLASGINKIRDGFLSLPAPIQQASVMFGAAAAAAGPLSLAIGTIIKLLPEIRLGFAALTGPVGLAVAAVAGAAILIVANWDSIKKILTDSGIWQTVTTLVSDAMNSVKSLFSAATSFVKGVWGLFGGTITQIIKGAFTAISGIISGAFTAIAAIFTTATGVLSGIIKVFTGIFTLDWTTLKEGLQNITVSIWNGILGIFVAGVKAVGGVLTGFLEQIGADKFAAAFAAKLKVVTDGANDLKIAVQGAAQAANTLTAPPAAATPGKTNLGGGAISGLSGGANGSSASDDAAYQKKLTQLEEFERRLKVLKELQQDNREFGITLAPATLYEIDALEIQIKRIKGEFNGIKPANNSISFADALSGLAGGKEGPTLPGLAAFQERIKKGQEDAKNAIEGFKNYLGIAKDQLAGVGVGLFEGLGASIAAGQSPLKGILQTITNFIGDFAIKLGSAILLMGKLETVAAALPFLAPLFALTGPAKIAVGAGLIVGGAAIKAIGATAFANGGIVSGPTLSLTGEYANARNNPEVIAPLDKLKNYIGRSGGTQVFIPDVQISGSDLRIVLSRANDDYNQFA